MKNFVFLIGRILINEKNFYSFLDARLFNLLNEFGAKIDRRNYDAIRNNIINDNKSQEDWIGELVNQISKALMPAGYEKMILKYMLQSIEFAEKHFLYPHEDAKRTLEILSRNYKLGIIMEPNCIISKIVASYELHKYFYCHILYRPESYSISEIFNLIVPKLKTNPKKCLFVGDRLDTHIQMANRLGMTTIMLTNSPFGRQVHPKKNEFPKFKINNLSELVDSNLIINQN